MSCHHFFITSGQAIVKETEKRLTADGSGAPQASGVGAQSIVAADQQVLHVLMLLLLARLCLRCHGNGGGTVLVRHCPRKLLRLRGRRGRGGVSRSTDAMMRGNTTGCIMGSEGFMILQTSTTAGPRTQI